MFANISVIVLVKATMDMLRRGRKWLIAGQVDDHSAMQRPRLLEYPCLYGRVHRNSEPRNEYVFLQSLRKAGDIVGRRYLKITPELPC